MVVVGRSRETCTSSRTIGTRRARLGLRTSGPILLVDGWRVVRTFHVTAIRDSSVVRGRSRGAAECLTASAALALGCSSW